MIDIQKITIGFLAGTLEHGGAECQLYHILKTLRRLDARLHVFCLTRGETWEARIKDLGIPVVWIGESGGKFERLVRLAKCLRKHPCDVIQSQHFFTNPYSAFAARLSGIREIGAIRSDCYSEVGSMGWFWGNVSLRCPRLIAANSLSGIRNAIKMGRSERSLYHLPNFVDAETFTPRCREGNREIRLTAIGRLSAEKRFDRFIRLVANLQKRWGKHVKGLIVGDGPLRGELNDQAAASGLLPEYLEFAGAVDEMADVYAKTDIVVLTSDWEGTPNVAMEAMACGLTVLATRVGGVPDLIRNGATGVLVDPEEEETLVRAGLRLIEDADLRSRLGEGARRYIVEHHSTAVLEERLRRLYDMALERGPKGRVCVDKLPAAHPVN